MLGWIWRTVVGHFSPCRHKWGTFSEVNVKPRDRETLAGTIYGQRCEKCGDIKQRYVGLQ